MAAEIQLLACGYLAQCTVRGCRVSATTIARILTMEERHSASASCATDMRPGSRLTARTSTI